MTKLASKETVVLGECNDTHGMAVLSKTRQHMEPYENMNFHCCTMGSC